jgi:transcription termination factor Rho
LSSTETAGVLDVTSGGAGFIRRKENGYLPTEGDIYVAQKMIQRFRLRTGDELTGEAGPSPGRGKNPPLTNLLTVHGLAPEEIASRPDFQRLSALHPKDQLVLECELDRRATDHTNRIVDLFCPFGKGQRAMIVAPAKAGKTMVLQAVAEGVVKNYPNATVLILLVDERPEEVTEMEMCGYGEVVASSFDHPADRHVGVAEITLERARRKVELGQDVVIILDSITRLARAYNTNERSSGKTLTGGLDSNALEKPKRFLGSARYIDPKQGGGSLTIIATALVDTGSRMDEVIFEEFKGTGNSELVLSRELADKRIWPAIDLTASATRREELLLTPDALQASHKLRRDFSDMSPPEAMDQLLARMRRTKTNDELVAQITSGRV